MHAKKNRKNALCVAQRLSDKVAKSEGFFLFFKLTEENEYGAVEGIGFNVK